MIKIILIDDDPIFNLIGKTIIQKVVPVSCDVKDFSDPQKAIDYLRTIKNSAADWPDFIFLDLRMPIYDGFQFLDDLNTFIDEVPKSDSRLYILSSSINLIDIERSKKHRIVKDFISKPLTEITVRKILLAEV